MPATISMEPRLAYPNPSVRYSYESCATSFEGNCAINTEISSTVVHSLTVCSNPFTSKSKVFSSKNFIRFNEARLHAVLSRNMYSEQGLDALMRPPSGQVCHSLMVVSYCTPGSAQAQAAWPIFSHSSVAGRVLLTLPLVRLSKCHGLSCSTASRNSL